MDMIAIIALVIAILALLLGLYLLFMFRGLRGKVSQHSRDLGLKNWRA